MADMDALFKNRKKKKGKKTLNKNFNEVLEASQKDESTYEPATQLYHKTDEDGRTVVVEEAVEKNAAAAAAPKKKIGGLTAAVNASKGISGASGKVLQVDGADLVGGEWVDDSRSKPQGTQLAANKGVADMDGLTSSLPTETKSYATLQAEAYNRQMFHRARMQAQMEAEGKTKKKEEKKKPEDDKPKVFRPRALVEARANREGAHALKELDNDAIFPTLGGGGAGASSSKTQLPASAWGVVQKSIVEDLLYKQTEGEYLGEDFIPAETFDGQKLGYSFKLGDEGQGYYWECKPPGEDDDEDEDNKTDEAAQDGEAAAAAAKAKGEKEEEEGTAAANAKETEASGTAAGEEPPAEPELSPAEIAAREEKERKRLEKKKIKEQQKAEWERQNALALEREKEEQLAKEKAAAESAAAPAPDAAAAPAGEAAPPEDRFSGLKKKKKKKKPAA
ncbi:Hypothetical Protein FCC1311_062602 [Hondaea fermentalgiana]|uniref:Uncharacterized protein n=1 Tax=Hondaea fermentalgiana TaxID=2315210 RepID=A0A2R5GGP0_9STRA|nr:Hypothetical Protein FCC1311_062602 [Hondaea fermentalgiana]|eukprot:GBG30040.1 Hypothetical Protein FCC1311_062602 [Hondaea fermentalgiana]